VKTRLPDMHTFMHVTIENQIASPDSPQAKHAMGRLLAEGLDRHEAVHAIGSVLAGFMPDLRTDKDKEPFDTQAYYAALDRLTKESWCRDSGRQLPRRPSHDFVTQVERHVPSPAAHTFAAVQNNGLAG
jgi:hypothetical protein